MMLTQSLLAALLATTAAAAPLAPQPRQLTGTDDPSGILGGLGSSSTPTATIPIALPTGLGGLLGGGLTGSGSGSSTTDPSGILSGLTSGTATDTGALKLLRRQSVLGDTGTSTGSSSSSLTSLLSGLTGSTTSGSSAATTSTASSSSGLGSLLGGGSDTEDGLTGACKSVTVLFARGTTESGNVGSVVGPGFTTALNSDLDNDVAVQGVDYAADAAGIISEATGPGTGSDAMIADVQTALTNCPSTQLILSGYSQGAMLVHNTMGALSTSQAASVLACVTWGDPFLGEAIKQLSNAANWKSFCATGDSVCDAGVASTPAAGGSTSASTEGHLGYGADVQTAADFIKGLVGA